MKNSLVVAIALAVALPMVASAGEVPQPRVAQPAARPEQVVPGKPATPAPAATSPVVVPPKAPTAAATTTPTGKPADPKAPPAASGAALATPARPQTAEHGPKAPGTSQVEGRRDEKVPVTR